MSGFWPGRRAKRRDAREQVVRTRSAVRARYVGLDERWGTVLHDAVVTIGGLAPGDGFALRIEEQRQLAGDALEAMTSAYLRTESLPDPEAVDDIDQLQSHAEAWATVGRTSDEATKRVDDVADLLARVTALSASARPRLTALAGQLDSAWEAVRAAEKDGFDVELLEEACASSARDLAEAKQAFEAKRLWDTDTTLRRAEAVVASAVAAARDLSARHRRLLVRHGELARRISDHRAVVDRVARTVAELKRGFAETVWDPVVDAPEQTRLALAEAVEVHAEAAEAATLETQRFDDADRALAHADSRLRAIAEIDAAVAAVRGDVDAAIAEYPAAHHAARQSLHEAVAFTRANAHDVHPAHLPNLDRAAAILADAERVAATGRGDPMLAVTRLREVDRYTDAVLYRARTDKQQRDAHRQAAVHMLRDAERAFHRARSASGLGLFGWSARAKADLDLAQRSLNEAGAVLGQDPARAMELAAQVEQIAFHVVATSRNRRAY